METKRRVVAMPEKDTSDMEKKIEEQEKHIEELERRIKEQGQKIKNLTASTPVADLSMSMRDEVKQIQEDVSTVGRGQRVTECDITNLKGNRDQMIREMNKMGQSQEQTDSAVAALKMNQREMTKSNQEIQSWQEQFAKYTSGKGDNQNGLKEKVFEKIDKTMTLLKQLHAILKGEMKDKAKFNVTFSLTQMTELVNGFPYKIGEFKKVKLVTKYFDSDTGVYTIPIRGRYRIYTKCVMMGNGIMEYYFCSSDGTRHKLALVTSDEPDVSDFNCSCVKGEQIWLEAKKLSGKCTIADCDFKGELLPDVDESKNDDNDDDSNNVAEALAKLLALKLLADNLRN